MPPHAPVVDPGRYDRRAISLLGRRNAVAFSRHRSRTLDAPENRMRKSLIGLAALAAAGLVMASLPAHAQQQSDAPAPPRPYTAIAVRLPTPSTDASYTAFRQQLAETARRKDRQALQQLLVTQNFFWQSADGERTDTKKSAIDNFSTAIGLDAKDGSGWDWLAAAAEEPTLEAVPDLKGVSCAPAGPAFDDKAFETVVNATGTDEG
jgi:hypothetical protein